MSDLFHEKVRERWLRQIFRVMRRADRHNFLILTKRAERMAALAPGLDWPQNVWMGVSVESSRYVERITHLQRVPAAVRFLSLEPLLGPIPNLPLHGIHWVIVGGESAGQEQRRLVRRCSYLSDPCNLCGGTGWAPKPEGLAWVRDLRDQCAQEGVPFFFKQWGGPRAKSGGRRLDGREWNEYPHPSRRSRSF
jgi:protein gp37